MKTPRLILHILLATAALSLYGQTAENIPSGITWLSKEETYTVTDKTAKEVGFSFTGKNNTDKVITIKGIAKSCGCQSLEVSQTVIQPGEETNISGIVTFAPSSGLHKKYLVVTEESGERTTLIMNVDTPKGVIIDKTILTWNSGDKMPQTVTITLPSDIEIGEARVVGKGFSLQTKQEDRKYSITVIPDETNGKGAIRILTKGENPIPYYVRLESRDSIEPEVQTKAAVEPEVQTRSAVEPEVQTRSTIKPAGSQKAEIEATKALLRAALERLENIQ